jgi:hypothetical protein
MYATRDQHFATAPLPPVPPYAMSGGNDAAFRDIYERRMVEEDFYGDGIPYVTAAAAGAENRAFESGSESYFEEEVSGGGNKKRSNDIRLLANG